MIGKSLGLQGGKTWQLPLESLDPSEDKKVQVPFVEWLLCVTVLGVIPVLSVMS